MYKTPVQAVPAKNSDRNDPKAPVEGSSLSAITGRRSRESAKLGRLVRRQGILVPTTAEIDWTAAGRDLRNEPSTVMHGRARIDDFDFD
ncbi:MAG: hypothetical protein WBX25_27800 [Rhodomicrobium sp.]